MDEAQRGSRAACGSNLRNEFTKPWFDVETPTEDPLYGGPVNQTLVVYRQPHRQPLLWIEAIKQQQGSV
jgi:hypothetical protein